MAQKQTMNEACFFYIFVSFSNKMQFSKLLNRWIRRSYCLISSGRTSLTHRKVSQHKSQWIYSGGNHCKSQTEANNRNHGHRYTGYQSREQERCRLTSYIIKILNGSYQPFWPERAEIISKSTKEELKGN